MPILRVVALACVLAAIPAAAASATPVATSDSQYMQLGRVFPDPLAGCQQTGQSPCSPNAQGNVPATQFIQYTELVDALKYMNSKPEWQRYLEVWPLDGKEGDGSGTDEKTAFAGNNLGHFEFTPKPEYQSAGLPTTDINRKKSDLYLLRVTDENIPDKGKKRFVYSLSIHAIERAGAEGGTRAMEDLVTAATTGTISKSILPAGVRSNPPTFGDVLRKSIIYFMYPNPDGWRRGSVSEGGFFFQRYNGNGVDVNRDWPDVGFSYRPYSGLSEPESRAFSNTLGQVRDDNGRFAAAADLHGQPEADALSFTLLPHGRHDLGKDLRIREAAKTIHRASEKTLSWSPIIQPNDAPQGGGVPCGPGLAGDTCALIYGQTWGTVYDTINYTTTGAMGDWFDSPTGLNADGLDNEMSFSHVDKNIVFEPHTEQLHVDGNKSLIYAHIAEQLDPPTALFRGSGPEGYVPNARVRRAKQNFQPAPPAGTVAQDSIVNAGPGVADPTAGGDIVIPFAVKVGPQPGGKNIFNGGMRVDITKESLQGVSAAVATLKVQCRGCDEHPGVKEDGDWVTVQEDFNQSPLYLQAGLTAAVNRPQAIQKKTGKPVEWRAVVSQPAVAARMNVEFTQGQATTDGSTGGGSPAELRGYDVANTDFFRDLNRFIDDPTRRFKAVDPAKVIVSKSGGPLAGLRSLVLADNALPGDYTPTLRANWYGKLKSWVQGGGNLVLTDGALRALPELTSLPASAVHQQISYVGQVTFAKSNGTNTLSDPLLANVKQDGARFNSGMRRQIYEPTPLGFSIQNQQDGSDESHSVQWDVDRAKFEALPGARVTGTSVDDEPDSAAPIYNRVAMGEVKLGNGTIRVLGAMLPQPTEKYDHTLGLEPYSVTYTGYIVFCNLVGANCAPGPRTSVCERDRFAPRSNVDRRRRTRRFSRRAVRFQGTSRDRDCRPLAIRSASERRTPGRVKRVEISLKKSVPGGCRYVRRNGTLTRRRSCKRPILFSFRGKVRYDRKRALTVWKFSHRFGRLLPTGNYKIDVRGIDPRNNREALGTRPQRYSRFRLR
jgi:Zinc carboxypeptidase